ncbi:acetyl-CoA hydrolase/transferase family protein [Polaromonas hydrogenivorans]|uniref:Acetyl-CoA hydrolase/transferase C-terminal domain-containing protein n=1 Tax=Polaromonas hydrogenivorans TaxID=335476 RepID=A0AAU7M250_9BURK
MAAEAIDFLRFLKKGDVISLGQACSEALTLTQQLAAQSADISGALGRLKIFLGGSFSGVFTPDLGAHFDFASYGAIGDGAALARAGYLDVFPIHYSQLPRLLAAGPLRPDVVLLQISPPDTAGRHSMGIASDYQLTTARKARVVIAEVNALVPWTCAQVPSDLRIDHFIHSDVAIVEVPSPSSGATAQRIAAHVASLVPDGATLQMGVGSVMDAVCRALHSHRNLGVHSGIIGDGIADLIASGVVNNARKSQYAGITVAGSLFGSRRLFDFAHLNRAIHLVETNVTHSARSLAMVNGLCAINSATEVDLTGQINAEVSSGAYIGAVGGQMDFLRAAANSDDGLSIIALPSTAAGGKISRIVNSLSGPVTTPRADVDCVVTEWGIAHLRGLSLRERVPAMAAIAHPDHRAAFLSHAVRT